MAKLFFYNYEFTFSELNDGNSFPGNFDITNQFIWSHSYDWNKFSISLGWSIRTGIPYTEALGIIENSEGAFIDYGEINSNRLRRFWSSVWSIR